MKRNAAGFTLIELLVVMSLIVILSLGAMPDFSQHRQRKEIDALMHELAGAIEMARSYAVAESVMVTFCRSDDGQRCQGSWSDGSILFTDVNADRVLNGGDRLLFRLERMKPAGTLEFKSFQNRQFLQMNSRGFTNYQNGNFMFCAANKDPRQARQLIVSFTGRTRFARDKDGDGVAEDSQDLPLYCK